MSVQSLIDNFMHPPVLFFFLGVLATLVKSDLDVPPQIGKFLGLYLLFHIGIVGGEELFHSGFSATVLVVMAVCVSVSFLAPFASYRVLRLRLDPINAAAIAAAYGSISAVEFATASSFLEGKRIAFGGYMVAGMALMESPAVIAGLILARLGSRKAAAEEGKGRIDWPHILHESFFNGSVLLLLGSLVIGYATGETGERELKPFVTDIFRGMLSLYMLDMGLLAGRRLADLRRSGPFLSIFALVYPPLLALAGMSVAWLLGLSPGNALLLTIMFSSASFIAVPAAMRLALPQANMGLLLPMTLGLTFTFEITLGIPLYFQLIQWMW